MDSMAKETEMMREKMKSLEKLDTDIRDIMKNDLAMAKLKAMRQIPVRIMRKKN